MDSSADEISNDSAGNASRRLSYKFQRLRERIRAAIDAGELAGKLPGERSLARQFNVNAKTLSKALTDLAAEGVLERNIGLGTFVRDGTATVSPTKLLVLYAPDQSQSLSAALSARGLDVQGHCPDGDLAPSLLAPYDLVLVASPDISDGVVRDLIVRGKAVLSLDRFSQPYSTHTLAVHTSLAAVHSAMVLEKLGHRRLLLVTDEPEHEAVHRAVTDALPAIEICPATPTSAVAAAMDGFTGVVCNARCAPIMLQTCQLAGVAIPETFSVMAYGRPEPEPICCGHYITNERIADTLADLLSTGLPHRPVTLWLAGELQDLGTTAPPRSYPPRP